MTRFLLLSVVLGLTLSTTALAGGAGGVTGPAFYVDGVLYRTVGTPTDISETGAPAHSFDTIYALAGQSQNVATAAPGDKGYNGGRWMVHAIAYNTSWSVTVDAHDVNGSGDLDSDTEVQAALADPGAGGATDAGVVKQFVCPVIELKG